MSNPFDKPNALPPFEKMTDLLAEETLPGRFKTKAEFDRDYEAWLRLEPRAIGLWEGSPFFDPFAARSDLAAGPECFTHADYRRERNLWKKLKPSEFIPEEIFL